MSEYLRREAAAKYLQEQYGSITRATLAKLACIGGGPLFRKFGRYPLYLRADLDSWAQMRLSPPVTSTSAAP